MKTTYEVLRIDVLALEPDLVEDLLSVEVKKTPSVWEFWFLGRRAATSILTFAGSGTVWHHFPEGTRAGTEVETKLCDAINAFKYKQILER